MDREAVTKQILEFANKSGRAFLVEKNGGVSFNGIVLKPGDVNGDFMACGFGSSSGWAYGETPPEALLKYAKSLSLLAHNIKCRAEHAQRIAEAQ